MENAIIANALFDLLDAIGAMTNTNEINDGLGLTVESQENILAARALLIQNEVRGA